jgi:hypothetical protein
MIHRTSIYQATYPLESHWRQATCKEVDCHNYVMGWVTRVVIGSDMDSYIKEVSKTRKYNMVREGGFNAYYFEAGQQCFSGEARQHRIKLERGAWLTKNAPSRSPLFLEQNAMDVDQWIDEFNEDSYKSTRR